MSTEVKQLIEFAVQDLVAEIVAREGLTIEEAMDALYHSSFFAKLTDPATGLYRESGEYLFAAMREPTHSTATRA